MDIHRPELGNARRRKRLIIAIVGAVVIAAATFGVSRMPQAEPEVDSSGLFIDTVKRGSMVRQVRGTGTLVPENVRWIPAATEARVERILVRPGVTVKADTVILELSNPEVEQAARDAELQLGSAVAELRKREIELESSVLAQRAVSAGIDAQLSEARLQADVDAELASNGLTSALTAKLSRSRAQQLDTRSGIEKKRLAPRESRRRASARPAGGAAPRTHRGRARRRGVSHRRRHAHRGDRAAGRSRPLSHSPHDVSPKRRGRTCCCRCRTSAARCARKSGRHGSGYCAFSRTS